MPVKRDKKGQELTISTLVLIVLGVVVLVLLVIGFTKGWDAIFGLFKFAPGADNLQANVKACDGYVQAGLTVDFCSFRRAKVDGVTQYVNCEDSRINAALEATGTKPSCTNTWQAYCMSQKLKKDTLVNGNACPGETTPTNPLVQPQG